MEQQVTELRAELAELARRQAEFEATHRAALARAERRTRAAGCPLGVAAAAALLAAAVLGLPGRGESEDRPHASKVTRVRAPFQVVDSRSRPVLQVDARGGKNSLTFFDTRGQTVVFFADEPGARGLDVRDVAGKKIVGMGTLAVQGGELRGLDVYDGQERHLLSLDVGSISPEKGIRLFSAAGGDTVDLVTDGGGAGRVRLHGADGQVTFTAP